MNTDAVPIERESVWQNLEVPYLIVETFNKEGFQVLGTQLTLDPGVEIVFGQGMALSMRERDGLKANLLALGTRQDTIKFLSEQNSDWKGIDFLDSVGTFDFVELRGGGRGPEWGLTDATAHFAVRSLTTASQNPGSGVIFGRGKILSSAEFGIAFSSGDTKLVNCLGAGGGRPIWVPDGQAVGEHCR